MNLKPDTHEGVQNDAVSHRPHAESSIVRHRSGSRPDGRIGASAGGALPIPVELEDGQNAGYEHLSFPSCPDEARSFIENNSLERLVYWKLQGLFDKFDEQTPKNILKTVLGHVELPLFAIILRKTGGNQSRAADFLGCNRNTLHRKLKDFEIQPKDVRKALKRGSHRSANGKNSPELLP